MTDQAVQGKSKDWHFSTSRNFVCDTTLSVHARLLYQILRSYVGKDSTCFPSRDRLCRLLDCCKDKLLDYMGELKNAGWVSSSQQKNGSRFAGNVYLVNDEPVPVSDSVGHGEIQSGTVSDSTGHGGIDTNIYQGRTCTSTEEEHVPEEEQLLSLTALPAVKEPYAGWSLIDCWNQNPDLARVRTVAGGRMRVLQARMREADFAEHWREGFERMVQSDFCMGKNSQNWKADIDWFLRPDTLTKILEGKYDNRGHASPRMVRPFVPNEEDLDVYGFPKQKKTAVGV